MKFKPNELERTEKTSKPTHLAILFRISLPACEAYFKITYTQTR